MSNRIPIPTKPYEITKDIWDDYYSVQQSGVMNMFGYPTVVYFLTDGSYRTAFKHFETDGMTDPVVIE
tara:strand:+ start:162 stop:365 length:204 start_codon:yes stop_codon:yes gene_type:complete